MTNANSGESDTPLLDLMNEYGELFEQWWQEAGYIDFMRWKQNRDKKELHKKFDDFSERAKEKYPEASI